MTSLVVDLGGTRIKAAAAPNLDAAHIIDVPSGGRDAIFEAIEAAGRALLGGEKPDAAAICVPGLVDEGHLVSLPGKLGGLEGADLEGFLRSAFGVEHTVVTNDAVAYAVGEATHGAGRGCRRSVVVTIGTGVGVTVIEEGRPATGGTLGAGILGGFIPISDGFGTQTDSIGRRDTIEALCAAQQIVVCSGGRHADIPAVYAAFAGKETAALKGIDTYRRRLSRALVALAHAHAPDRMILGGGPMTEDNPIVGGLEALVNERLFGTYRVEVRLASLGDAASLTGLAHLLGRRP